MGDYILIIDSKGRISHVAEMAIRNTEVKVLSVDSVAAAKRKLVQAIPSLIVCSISFPEDEEGGYRFCQELQAHSQLAEIPVILVGENLGDDVIRLASDCGAKGLMGWPLTGDALRTRMNGLVPTLFGKENKAGSAESEQQAPAKNLAAEPPLNETGLNDEKLRLAQHLLAKVLHNLKTSDLLQVVEFEDVPRVVCEIARSVCGIKEEEVASARKSNGGKAHESEQQDIEMDLDSAFNLKK